MRSRRVALRRVAPASPAPLGPDERAVQRDDERRVARAVAGLPQRQRECLVLRYWLDLSEREIADTLEVSVGSVKTHVHRALASVASQFVDDRS
jgi:RNA polymerase sigma factor (sigma-70 family)